MSMLAEPRRRQKWALNPRGNLRSKDEDKLGNKMMEKMGWKSGKYILNMVKSYSLFRSALKFI